MCEGRDAEEYVGAWCEILRNVLVRWAGCCVMSGCVGRDVEKWVGVWVEMLVNGCMERDTHECSSTV